MRRAADYFRGAAPADWCAQAASPVKTHVFLLGFPRSGTTLVEQALAGLKELIARYWDPAQPFISRTAPQFVHQYASDYDHLARVFEWSTSGDEGDE